MSYDELRYFLQKTMKLGDGRNYQPVMIRILNQNDGKATKEKIQQELHNANPEFPPEYFKEYPFDVLEENGVVKFNKTDNTYDLLAYKTYHNKTNEKGWITTWCNERILESKTITEIKKLSDVGVSNNVQKALLWYWKRRGKTYNRDNLSQPNRDGFIEKDLLLDGDQRLHGMVKGVYKAKGENYAQAITLNPKSKWGMELKHDYPTIRIDYDFKDPKIYSDQISWIEKIKEYDLPVGVAFCIGKNKWRILGLCKIKDKLNDTTYRLEHWGISDQESKKLKDDVIHDYDHYHIDTELKKYEAINWSDFSSELGVMEQKSIPKNMSSDKKNIANILYEITEGDWVLPEFQRFFEWEPKQVTGLLNSIFHGYYVGSFLLWDVTEFNNEPQCDTFPIEDSVPKKRDKYTMIILDGQQRITSLNYAINAPEKTELTSNHPGYFYINCKGFLKNDEEDKIVRTEKKIPDNDTFDRLFFPLYHLEKPDDWIDGLRDFLKKQNTYSEKFEVQIFNPIRQKTTQMKDFDIPIIYLKRSTYGVVSRTFELINTTGKKLELFDLMNNRLAGKGIKLREQWKITESKFPLIKKYNQKMEAGISRYIMESISLSYTSLKSCKKADILDMYHDMEKKDGWTPEKFKKMWEDISEYVNIALEHLEDKQKGFGVPDPDFLPYEPMLPVLVSLIQQIKNNFRKDDESKNEKKLRQWYWTSVFGERYSQGVEGRKASDFKSMIDWFTSDENIPKFIVDFQKDYKRIPFEEVIKSKSARYRGVMCLIMKKGAIDTKIRFSPNNKQHMDHIFPKSKLTKLVKNSILNMTLLTDITNISKTNKMPKEYYTEIKRKNYGNSDSELLKVLSSHLISPESYEYLLDNNFDEFIESRKKEILKAIANEMDMEYVDDEYDIPTQTSKDTKYGNRLVLRNAIESCNKELIWISRYLGHADLETLYIIRKHLKVKKIRLLTSKYRADESLKSDFKSFKQEMSTNHGIECEMKVMSKDVEEEQHARYLADPDKCYNTIDTEIAQRGQTDDVSQCKRPPKLEKWWNDSFDIFNDWNKFYKNKIVE